MPDRFFKVLETVFITGLWFEEGAQQKCLGVYKVDCGPYALAVCLKFLNTTADEGVRCG